MTHRKILVTGGCGNIGSALVHSLVRDARNSVVIADDLSTGRKDNLPATDGERCRFVKLDVNDVNELTALMTHVGFDFVFHFAAVVGVQRTLNNPLKVFRDIDGIRNVLNLCKCTGVKRFFYSSSSEVYGEPVEIPSSEATTPLNSKLPYAIVKNLSESYIRTYYREFGLEFTIFRFFNTYGPRQSEDFVIPRMIRAAQRGEPLTIYGNGSQTRTFCYVDDNIETQIRCLNENRMVNETMNIGSDREITILELAQLIIQQTGSASEIVHLPALPEGDMNRRCPDVKLMQQVLNRGLVSLPEGIARTAAFLRSRS